MKKTTSYLLVALAMAFAMLTTNNASAQQYKLRQVNKMMQMQTETTIYVKGMRKRTEGGTIPGMGANLVTIEQCDKQRTITINDKKKLYYIEPFANDAEVTVEGEKTANTKPKPPTQTTAKKGGTIYMYYNITDTGERKKFYGFTARHVWTTQKIKPSADACYMKDSMVIKTDGWYIDFPEFNCPVRYSPGGTNGGYKEMDCKDKYVSKVSGKGKLGFPLQETRTIIMGNGSTSSSNFETTLETLELSTQKLDSMLFEIPPGYTEAKNMDDLQEKPDMAAMLQQQTKSYTNNEYKNNYTKEEKKEGMIRIGVFAPSGEGVANTDAFQQYISNTLRSSTIEAIAIETSEDAMKYSCDYTLQSDFIKLKPAAKVGGLLKAIKNADPNATSSFAVELTQTLKKVKDGTTVLQPKINGKYSGGQEEAARKALGDGCSEIIKGL